MARTAIHVGSASRDALRALVVASGEITEPTMVVRDHVTGQSVPFTFTAHAKTQLAQALTARGVHVGLLVATGLTAGAVYDIEARSPSGTAASARVRTLPASLPVGGMTVAVGSCLFRGYPGYRSLAEALRARRLIEPPQMLVLGGDNVYVDVLDGGGFIDGDPGSVLDRYLFYFLDPALAEARGVVPAFTIWDDHEFWNDYPEPQPWLPFSWKGQKRDAFEAMAHDCLDAFAADLNPPGKSRSYQVDLSGSSPGTAGISFFFADARASRSHVTSANPQMMPDDAFTALLQWAAGLSGPGVLVIGQPLWIQATFKVLGVVVGDHNPPSYRRQYDRLMAAIRDAPWDILVVSGDVHYSRLLRVTLGGPQGSRPFYELVSSPLVHIPKMGAIARRGWFGLPQDSGAISDPSVVPELPGARAEYLGGTAVPNTFGLVRFTPVAAGVRVGVSFEDLASDGRAPMTPTTNNGTAPPGVAMAPEGCTFTLRKR